MISLDAPNHSGTRVLLWPAAMWVDLKLIANASGDEEVAREIHAWLGLRLERWLMNETEVALEYFSDGQSYYHDRLLILLDGVS